MGASDRSRHASCCVAAAMLAACGGSQPPIGEPGAMTQVGARPFEGSLMLEPQRIGSHKYRILFDFGTNVYGLDGADPVASLINVNGTLYGTTEYGGAYHGGGTVFSLSTSGLNERVLYSFRGNGPYVGGPVAGLIYLNGMLYGTTATDGLHGGGTIFRISPSGTNYRVLYNFGNGLDAANPRGNLIALHDKLYGTTYQGGGAAGAGVAEWFSRVSTNGKERVIHSFSGRPDGEFPLAGLINVNGTLYGTTEGGGANGAGSVFSVSTTGVEHVLYSFNGSDGEAPDASLIDIKDTLYGTTAGGGQAKDGTVFSMSTAGTNERVLHSFGVSSSDGISPVAAVIAVKGALYGTTVDGGTHGYGTAFRVTMGSERVLHDFNYSSYHNSDGINPQAALVYVKDTLFGTTFAGGVSLPSCPRSGSVTCDFGTVFALAP